MQSNNANTGSSSGSGSSTNNPAQPTQNPSSPTSPSPPIATAQGTTPPNPAGGNFLAILFAHTPGIAELPPLSTPSSQSSESDNGTPESLLCTICSRRESSVLFVACGHRACRSCTKRLWNSMRNLENKPLDPWPASFPCPFCRGVVADVRDNRDQTDTNAGPAAVSGGVGVGGHEGVMVAEWVLGVSGRARGRLESEMAGLAPEPEFTEEDFM